MKYKEESWRSPQSKFQQRILARYFSDVADLNIYTNSLEKSVVLSLELILGEKISTPLATIQVKKVKFSPCLTN
jgi:hypothetical protein